MNALNAMKTDVINYLVIGAGMSGWSALNFLQNRREHVRVMDDRLTPPYLEQINQRLTAEDVTLGRYDEQWIMESDVIILSPGVSPYLPIIQKAMQSGVEVIGDIELFARYCKKPYIAITGSNGKSTVTTLVADILNNQGVNAVAGGNIGQPALDLLNDDAEIYVLELSSFQLETCPSLQAQAAVVLNISDDHMDRHNTLEEYTRVKMSIYQHAKRHVYSRHLDYRGLQKTDSQHQPVSFGLDAPGEGEFGVIEIQSQRWLAFGNEKIIPVTELSLIGATGELNTLAALSLSYQYIHNMPAVVELLKNFTGLPYRCQIISTKNGIDWINDSKGTNIGATIAAIESISVPLVLILGGVHKGGSITTLVDKIEAQVKSVIVFGRDKDLFKKAISRVPVISVDSLDDAVHIAANHVKAGEAVLFSPACASFDMYANYQARGDAFNHAVKKLSVEKQHES